MIIRRIRRLGALPVAVALLAAACGPAESSDDTSTTEATAPPPTTAINQDTGSGTTVGTSEAPPEEAVVIQAASPLALLLSGVPVLPPVEGEQFVNPGAAIEHDGRIELFSNSFSLYPGPSVIHRWTSDDGLEWTLASPEPVLATDDVPYTDGNVFIHSVEVTTDGWVAWLYTYEGSSQPGLVGRATAPDPAGPWTVDPEPVLAPGPGDEWDGERLSHPTVVRDGDGYRMYYGGRDRRGTSAIGLATSPDGVTWTKHDDPSTPSSSDPVLVAAGVWDAGTIARPRVVPHDDGWLLLYAAAAIGTGSVGLATSADGVSWDPHPENPILARGAFGRASLFDYALIPFDGRLLWLFEYGGGSTRTDLYALELIRPDALSRMEVTATVSGDTVDVEVTAAGITLDFVASDTSAATAHPHVFVDRARPFPGEEVPLGDPTIVHARGNTLSVAGLEPGSHTLWVVLANGADEVLAPPAPIQLVVMIEAAD